jgi:hypothetical protein
MESGLADPQFFRYFLDPRHHAPGTPTEMVSFHFYAIPALGQEFESWQYSVFDQLGGLINRMAFIDAIRKELSPTTRINVGELGTGIPEDFFAAYGRKPVDTTGLTPEWYWNLAAAFYADAFIELNKKGADVISASQLVGYPPEMIPSIRLIDLDSGKPLPELQVLELLTRHLRSSRIRVPTVVVQEESGLTSHFEDDEVNIANIDIAAQAFRTDAGRRLLLVNKRNRSMTVVIESSRSIAEMEIVDESGSKTNARESKTPYTIDLQPFAVAMLSFN